jgi:hypothetical protein
MAKKSVLFGTANLVGVVIFLSWSASCCWVELELQDVPGASGGSPIVWVLGPFILCVVCILADFVWAVIALINGFRKRQWLPLISPFVMLGVWTAAFILDGVHHAS